MSLYTTPLQIGYFFSLLMWVILLVRGHHEQRLSDKLLGWVMFILAMELQDYTFGFAGINFLWDELNGFPRGVSLLFGPMVYFYFRSQVNRSFKIRGRRLLHFVPYLIYFMINISIFIQGKEAVINFQGSRMDTLLSYAYGVVLIISYIYYLVICLKIYRKYRIWSTNQFSTDLINFTWFRNFIYAMISWLFFRQVMQILDAFLNLDFYQEWWWNLALVVVAFYIGLAGFAQKQPTRIAFDRDANKHTPVSEEKNAIAIKLENIMARDRLYLQPELSLGELAQLIQVKPAELSATINQVYRQNFNDYINSLRIEAFIRKYHADGDRIYTLLSLALDSGFNSKATFNRAFKKVKGMTPREFLK